MCVTFYTIFTLTHTFPELLLVQVQAVFPPFPAFLYLTL